MSSSVVNGCTFAIFNVSFVEITTMGSLASEIWLRSDRISDKATNGK